MGLKGTWHNLALDNHNRYNCYQATNTLKGVVLPWKMQHTKAPWPVEHCIRNSYEQQVSQKDPPFFYSAQNLKVPFKMVNFKSVKIVENQKLLIFEGHDFDL